MLSEQTPWHVKVKEAITAAAWKKITIWVIAASLAGGGSLLAFGRDAIDYGVKNSDSYQKLEKKVDQQGASLKKLETTQKEFFGAMMDVDPELRKAVESRASATDAAERKRISDSLLLDRLGGGR